MTADMEWLKHESQYVIVISSSLLLSCGFVWLCLKIWKDYPVNCWFCNQNSRVRFKERNSWSCQHCLQYNGFTSDGDYNKPLYKNMQPNNKIMYNYNKFPLRSTSNGLCHKCNTNQQLKVMQLAKFKPMNQNNYDKEIKQFQSHLEEVYKLCKKCRKFLNSKLQNEKGAFLVPKKNSSKTVNKSKNSFQDQIKKFLKRWSLKLTYIFLLIVIVGICLNANLYFSKKMIRLAKQHTNNILNIINYKNVLSEDVLSVAAKYTTVGNFSIILNHTLDFMNQRAEQYGLMKYLLYEDITMSTIGLCLQALSILTLVLQITLFLFECGRSLRTIFNIVVWNLCGYLLWSDDKYLLIFQPVLVCFVLWNTKASIATEKSNSNTSSNSKVWKNMKNLSSSSHHWECSEDVDDLISEDSDFDYPSVGHNRTSTPEPENHYCIQGNYLTDGSQISRPYGFQIYSPPSQSFNSYNPLFKPAQYQLSNITGDLDKGIGTLSLDSKNVLSSSRSPNIFVPIYYNSPSSNSSMCSPTPTMRRPVLSPGRFVYSTQQSWVAGGYWGTESPKKTNLSHDTSRSSSQSSGFESMTSGNFRRGCLFTSRGDGQSQNMFNNKSDEPLCNKSVYNNSYRQSGNVFQNVSNIPLSTKSPQRTLFNSGVEDSSSTLENLNLLREYTFVTPNSNNLFLPVDKPAF